MLPWFDPNSPFKNTPLFKNNPLFRCLPWNTYSDTDIGASEEREVVKNLIVVVLFFGGIILVSIVLHWVFN